MQYKDLFEQSFRVSFDKLMNAVTDFKTALTLKNVKKSIVEQAESLDKRRAKMVEESSKSEDDAVRKGITNKLEEMANEEILIERIVVDGIENMGFSALVLEQLEKVIVLPDVNAFADVKTAKNSK